MLLNSNVIPGDIPHQQKCLSHCGSKATQLYA